MGRATVSKRKHAATGGGGGGGTAGNNHHTRSDDVIPESERLLTKVVAKWLTAHCPKAKVALGHCCSTRRPITLVAAGCREKGEGIRVFLETMSGVVVGRSQFQPSQRVHDVVMWAEGLNADATVGLNDSLCKVIRVFLAGQRTPLDAAVQLGVLVKRQQREQQRKVRRHRTGSCLLYTSPSPRDRG